MALLWKYRALLRNKGINGGGPGMVLFIFQGMLLNMKEY